MRIALITSRSPLSQAAPHSDTIRITALARALAEAGHRITIYARRDAADLPDQAILAPRVTVEHVTAGPAAPLPDEQLGRHAAAFAGYLAKRWRAKPPDLAHGYSWISGLVALAGARGLGIPVAQTFCSLSQADLRSGAAPERPEAQARLEASIARAAAMVFASSSDEAAELIRFGVPRTSVCVVPVGVDTSSFTPARRRAERGKHHQLLAVAPLDERAGLEMVIRTVSEVPGAELTIAGGPPARKLSRDRDYLRLSALARKLGVRSRVTFTGQVSEPELVELLQQADVLISAAGYDPSGMTAIQAMACGTPVVGPAVGSHRDAVIDGTTGVLIPPGQRAALASRLRTLLASPALLEAYGIAAADRARSRYSWDRIARETAAAYERVLRAPAASRAQDSSPAAARAVSPAAFSTVPAASGAALRPGSAAGRAQLRSPQLAPA